MADVQGRRFWLAIGMLLIVGVTMALSTTTLLEAADEVDRDIVRVDAWNDLDTAVVEVDQAAADYLLTADNEARLNYETAKAQLGLAALRVNYLASGVDDATLFALLARHRDAVDRAVIARSHAASTATVAALRQDHRALVTRIRSLISQPDDHVEVRERERARTAKAALVERVAQLVGLATSLTFVVAAFISLRRQVRQRREIAAELQQLNADLEERVGLRTGELVATNERLQKEIVERHKTNENLRSTEEQLRQSQKLDGIGRLAGGIAHDFNNLLSVIISYGEMLVEEVEDPAHRADIDEMKAAALRAAELTRQLLAFSRRQVLAPKVVDLNQVVDGMGKLLHRVIGEHIELRVLGTSKAKVQVDPGQMEQVIMNLVVNARDAMPHGGCMTVETADVILDDEYAATHEGVVAGPHVMMAITDTGQGMTAETTSRIFEPFFTTKPLGKGTGMGLATVFGIVKQSRGSVWVYSELGEGTTFKVFIPAMEATPVRSSAASLPSFATQGHERILLVEDDVAVRKLANAMLTRAGYTVLEAGDGQNALEVWKDRRDSIDLVLTDVVMPRMGGRPLVESLRRERPSLPVIYMSGYTDDTVLRHGIIEDTVRFVQKPIAKDLLLRKIRDALERGHSVAS